MERAQPSFSLASFGKGFCFVFVFNVVPSGSSQLVQYPDTFVPETLMSLWERCVNHKSIPLKPTLPHPLFPPWPG